MSRKVVWKKFHYEGILHPKWGGDDLQVRGHAIAESKPIAKRTCPSGDWVARKKTVSFS